MGESERRPSLTLSALPAARTARLARYFLVEARPVVQVIFLLRFFAGAAIAAGGLPVPHLRVVCGIAAWWLATLFAYGINGVCDTEEDRMNRTNRPIALGLLPVPAASAASVAAAMGSVVLAFLSGSGLLLALDLGFLFVGYAYSARPLRVKRTLAGAAISVFAMGTMTYAAGWSVVPHAGHGVEALIFGAGMSMWMCFVGAVTKDFAHVRGDVAAGHNNAVALLGDVGARAGAGCAALVVATGMLLAALRSATILVLPAAVLCAGAVLVAWRCANTRSGEADSKGPYRAFMLTQHLVHAAVLIPLTL